MKPQTESASRQRAIQIMTIVGIGLFIIVGLRAVKGVSDRRYVEGKPRTAAVNTEPQTVQLRVDHPGSAAVSTVQLAADDKKPSVVSQDLPTATDPSSPGVVSAKKQGSVNGTSDTENSRQIHSKISAIKSSTIKE